MVCGDMVIKSEEGGVRLTKGWTMESEYAVQIRVRECRRSCESEY